MLVFKNTINSSQSDNRPTLLENLLLIGATTSKTTLESYVRDGNQIEYYKTHRDTYLKFEAPEDGVYYAYVEPFLSLDQETPLSNSPEYFALNVYSQEEAVFE